MTLGVRAHHEVTFLPSLVAIENLVIKIMVFVRHVTLQDFLV